VALGYYNNQAVMLNPSFSAHYLAEPQNSLSFMSNWDGPNYLHIAKDGYNLGSTNFFPLYPILISLLSHIVGSPLDSALYISWICLAGAIFFYLKILKLVFKIKSNHEAIRGVLFFIFYPTAVFLLATYTESLFSFLALGAIYFALKKHYIPAALLTALASATHITGGLVIVLILLILLEEAAPKLKALATAIVGCTGLVAYSLYLKLKFHKPLAFITSQKSHGWLGSGFHNFVTSVNAPSAILALLLVVAAIYWWKKRKSFSIYCIMFLLIPILGREWGGFARYTLEAYPLQMMFYAVLRDKKNAYALGLAVSAITWAYFLFQYAAGYVGG
jgi:Gpi18-like mannosyltransferase